MKKLLLAGAALVALVPAASAADLAPLRTPISPVVVAPAGFNWTGFYLGAHLGYGWARNAWTFEAGPVFTANNANGLFGGVQLGYNWQFNQAVLGIEGDIGAAGIAGSALCPNPLFICRSRTDFLSTLRLRAGYAVDRALLYVTGGLAVANFRHQTINNPGPVFGTFNTTRAGFAVGGGLEYAFTPNWTAKVEYMYYNFGTMRQGPGLGALDGLTGATRIVNDMHTVRIGVNYLFSTGGGPITSRF